MNKPLSNYKKLKIARKELNLYRNLYHQLIHQIKQSKTTEELRKYFDEHNHLLNFPEEFDQLLFNFFKEGYQLKEKEMLTIKNKLSIDKSNKSTGECLK